MKTALLIAALCLAGLYFQIIRIDSTQAKARAAEVKKAAESLPRIEVKVTPRNGGR